SSASGAFDKLDKNHDGYISRDEARADPQVSRDWSKMDTDHDNKLSRSEFDAHGSGASGATSGDVPSSTTSSTTTTRDTTTTERAPRSDRN
ncbi:MAG TPA: hypothetical protein VLN59_07155, partial [Burkholderiales bacterium]|nr:hypothetical protein [Burkholderiales bacterium]